MRTLANACFSLCLLRFGIWLSYSKLIHISQVTRVKIRRKAKEEAINHLKTSGDQVEFLGTTRLGPNTGMQRVMDLLITLVLYPGVINGLWHAVTVTRA